ncbi:MAG: hypothetical protein IJ164_02030 [Duodenibacillus sp.]|nr:hypothetical protein [Duodenibacillus sp.]
MDESTELLYHRPSDFCPAAFSGCSPVFHWTFGLHKGWLANQLSEFLSRALSIRL